MKWCLSDLNVAREEALDALRRLLTGLGIEPTQKAGQRAAFAELCQILFDADWLTRCPRCGVAWHMGIIRHEQWCPLASV